MAFLPAGIKQSATQVSEFFRADYSAKLYVGTALFLTISAVLNYAIGFDDNFLEPLIGTRNGIICYFCFYSFAYFSVAIPSLWFSSSRKVLVTRKFWLFSIFFVGVIGVEGGMAIPKTWFENAGFENTAYWAHKTMRQLDSILIWIPAYYFFMRITQSGTESGIYGLRLKYEDLKPYIVMLWVMVPLITAASFLPDFQRQYPIFRRVMAGLPAEHSFLKYGGLAVYECAYLASFSVTELMFRGALVIGMSSLMGRHAILPMVSCYMFLHFGKPAGEAISSVFGGYILGVLAYRNHNIMGGIFIHSCVAFLMDVTAAAQQWRTLFP